MTFDLILSGIPSDICLGILPDSLFDVLLAFFFGSDVPQRAGWLAIGFGSHPCWDVLKSRAHMFPFDNCRASHTGDAIVVWALVLFMCSARARRCRAPKPTIFRLSALRSTDWARQPLYKGHALQIPAQRGYIQTTTAAQREQRPQAEEGAERANTGTASLCGKATEKVAPEASLKPGHRTPFWRIHGGTKRGPAAGKGRSLRLGCGGSLFGGSRRLTAQKGVQQQEKVEVWG